MVGQIRPERVRRGIELTLQDLVTCAYRIPGEVRWQVSACGSANTLQKGKYTGERAV